MARYSRGFLKGTGGSPLERPSSADFLGVQEVGPPAGAGPGNLCRRRRHIWSAPEGRDKSLPSPGRNIENRRAAKRARDSCRRRRLRLGFRPAGPGRMATPYGESKGVAKRQPEWGHHLSRRDKWRLWPSLNARRRSAALAAGEERIYARAGRLKPPLSALLPPTSWARKKSARPPGRVPAFPPP